MSSDKHMARKEIILSWLASDECVLEENKKEAIKELWNTPADFPSLEKAIWNATRTELKEVENSPIDSMKTVDSVRAAIGSDLADMETDLIAFHDKYGDHLRQKGKAGVFAEVMIGEFIRRLR